jgi:hypothetical protein
VTYAVGIGPRCVAVGDFNRDGNLDLVVANFGSNTISILLGNGDGTFQSAINVETLSPAFVTVGDFNRDGKQDLAVANASSNTVSILLGIGNGAFTPFFKIAAGPRPVSITAGDFNGDGKTDLAVANSYANTVSILLGNGNGTFRSALLMAAGANPSSVAAADFNRDGKLDLAAVNASPIPGTVSLLLGLGNGFFQPPLALASSVETNPTFVVVGDFNLDGKPDLAVANTASGTISVLMGLGNGLFATPLTFDVGAAPVWMAVTDLNADGKPDLVVAKVRPAGVGAAKTVRCLSRPSSIDDERLIGFYETMSHGRRSLFTSMILVLLAIPALHAQVLNPSPATFRILPGNSRCRTSSALSSRSRRVRRKPSTVTHSVTGMGYRFGRVPLRRPSEHDPYGFRQLYRLFQRSGNQQLLTSGVARPPWAL